MVTTLRCRWLGALLLFCLAGFANTAWAQSCINGVVTMPNGSQTVCPASYGCAGPSSCATVCSSDANCQATAYCQASTGQCLVKLAQGSACTANNQCQSGLTCNGGMCQAAQATTTPQTQPSNPSVSCQNGILTVAGKRRACAPYTCNAAGTSCQVACSNDRECATGFMCRNTQCVLRPKR